MKPAILAPFGFTLGSLASGSAKADTIFEVEHARANYRAGLVCGDDEGLFERWGRPSG